MEITALHERAFLQLRDGNRTIYGYNQEWYTTEWQRCAGCGPTTAAVLADYIGLRDGILTKPDRDSVEKRRRSMEEVWRYVTPGQGGLYKTSWFKEGLQAYLDRDWTGQYETEMLRVYPFHIKPVAPDKAAQFIYEGLRNDSPVAFLNRNRGKEPALSTWHWIPIVGIDVHNDQYECTCYDDENRCCFSLNRWLERTSLGGGFVYVKTL